MPQSGRPADRCFMLFVQTVCPGGFPADAAFLAASIISVIRSQTSSGERMRIPPPNWNTQPKNGGETRTGAETVNVVSSSAAIGASSPNRSMTAPIRDLSNASRTHLASPGYIEKRVFSYRAVKRGSGGAPVPQQAHVRHLIHAVCAKLVVRMVGNQIAAAVRKQRHAGVHRVNFAVPARNQRFLKRMPAVLKREFFTVRKRFVNAFQVVERALIRRRFAARLLPAAAKPFRFEPSEQRRKFCVSASHLARMHAAGTHEVDQLANFAGSTSGVRGNTERTRLLLRNRQSALPQQVNIRVHRPPVGSKAFAFEMCGQFRSGNGMAFVRTLN